MKEIFVKEGKNDRMSYPWPKKFENSWQSLLIRSLLQDPDGPVKMSIGYGVSVLESVLERQQRQIIQRDVEEQSACLTCYWLIW